MVVVFLLEICVPMHLVRVNKISVVPLRTTPLMFYKLYVLRSDIFVVGAIHESPENIGL